YDSPNLQHITPDQLPGLLGSSTDPRLSRASAGSLAPGSLTDEQQALAARLSGSAGTDFGIGSSSVLTSPDLPLASTVPAAGSTRGNVSSLPHDEKQNSPPELSRRVYPYANVPSLYDMYQQVSPRTARLERFGADIFRNGTGNFEQLPMDLPVGP